MTALEDAGLTPARLSGASAGALVAGVWASGRDALAIRDALVRLRREHFWDPAPGLGLLRGRLFRALLDETLAARTFDACRAPVAVSAFDLYAGRTVVLQHGELAPAIQASCTLPGLFQPTVLGGRALLDGGIFDRPGVLGMPRDARLLYHHLPTAGRAARRARDGALAGAPRRDASVTLAIEALPAVGPFALARGITAFEGARRATLHALDRSVGDARVVVTRGG
jgi:NTE family protein